MSVRFRSSVNDYANFAILTAGFGHINAHVVQNIDTETDGRTDGQTDRRTDGRHT